MIHRRRFIQGAVILAGSLSQTEIEPSGLFEGQPGSSEIFKHAVASGDPLSDSIVIWTRLSVSPDSNVYNVKWTIAKDIKLTQVVQSGNVMTGAETDYTVKVDVKQLQPAVIYYYQFSYNDITSPIGRAKTTEATGMANCQFAVVSCNNFSAGYFNAFARIAEKKEFDAVIHLGDYIYEGTARDFDNLPAPEADQFESTHFNRNKNWWLHYYRTRYAINRLDTDLQAAHLAHSFITIWDDHEIADNAWKNGSRAHNDERDGEWPVRVAAAKQAYAEWMPIRGDANHIYRAIRFGDMAELILLDTRIEGRDQQIYNGDKPEVSNAERTLLGKTQKEWVLNKLKTSTCKWKVLGSQVIFSNINIEWLASLNLYSSKLKMLEETIMDYWQGYPAERSEVMNLLTANSINNVVILSASFHCALAFDVVKQPAKAGGEINKTVYDPVSHKGSIAVEFAAPSISSENFDEKIGSLYAGIFQSMINNKLPQPLGYNANPHMKFADLQQHGYFVLQFTKEHAKARFYFVDSILKKSKGEKGSVVWLTRDNHNFLEKAPA